MFYKTIACVMVSMMAFGVCAQEVNVPVSARQSLTMTIYNQGIALVKDVRSVAFKQGANKIAFSDVSDQMMPQTVLAQANHVAVEEQNFNFDLLTHENLMKKAIGSTVDIQWTNPATGDTKTEQAQLLAYSYDGPVLKIGNKIETKYPGRILFNSIPKNLWAQPTLILNLTSSVATTENLSLSYLTNGLTWSADYVAELSANDDQMSLNGLVTLTNNTQVSYENATLQLVAGDVNLNRPQPIMMRTNKAMMMDSYAVAESAMGTQQVGDYYLYTLDRPTDIASNQTKQVALLESAAVKVQKQYKLTDLIDVARTNQFKNAKPAIYLNFDNKKADGLGLPLPKGTVRVYKKDEQGRLIFIGEDGINHTANDQKVTLNVGKAFDITAEGKKTSFTSLGKDSYEAAFEVMISNAMKTPVTVRFEQTLPNTWRILSESLKSKKENADMIYWNVDVPADGQTVLSFKVQVQKQ